MNNPHATVNPIPGVIMTPTPTPVTVPIQTQTQTPTPTPTDLVPVDSTAAATQSLTKEQVKDYLRQWIRIENEISTLSVEIKKRKLVHQQLSASLLEVMRKNDIDCFDITNGKIVYSKVKHRAPLNNGQLRSALTTYYKDDTEKANNLTEFLLSSRIEKTRESIKMKIPKA